MVSDIVDWGPARLEVTFEPGAMTPEIDPISSVRGIVFDRNRVLVVTNEHESHLLPGGRVEQDESLEQALEREILEETGWTIDACLPLGYLRFRHLSPKPLGYTHPYPAFVQKVYVARVGQYDPGAKKIDDYERNAEFRRIEELRPMTLPRTQWEILEVAGRLLRQS